MNTKQATHEHSYIYSNHKHRSNVSQVMRGDEMMRKQTNEKKKKILINVGRLRRLPSSNVIQAFTHSFPFNLIGL